MKFLTLAIFAFTTNALAASPATVGFGQPQCYGREYSEAHMQSNTLQTVKKMDVKFYKYAPNEPVVLMQVNAQIKRSKTVTNEDGSTETYDVIKPYANTLVCDAAGKTQLNCYIECDGGSATVSWDVKTVNKQLTFTNKGFIMYGGCGEDVDENDWVWLDNKKGGDDVFKLYALPAEYCQQ